VPSLVLDGGKRSTSRPGRSTPEETNQPSQDVVGNIDGNSRVDQPVGYSAYWLSYRDPQQTLHQLESDTPICALV
jgi:hypothetical protein